MKTDPGTGVRLDSGLRRGVDVVVAAVALLVALPVAFVLGLAIMLDSRGPVVFAQERIGRGRRPFRMHKLRTMVADAERVGPAVGGRRDPRVTRVGQFLRRTKLDELPQLVDVLLGRMTIVGPRAEVARYVEHYSQEELGTLLVRPGVTGAGQLWFTISQADELDGVGDPERLYLERQLPDKLARDLAYLRRRGLRADLALVGRTLAALVGLPVREVVPGRHRRADRPAPVAPVAPGAPAVRATRATR